MTSATIYHNPRCSKSRATLSLLESRHDLTVTVIRYLEQPPGNKTLKTIVERLGVEPMAIIRTGEDQFKESGLGTNADIEAVCSAIEAAPILMQRPIVVVGEQARIGRPPESVLEILP